MTNFKKGVDKTKKVCYHVTVERRKQLIESEVRKVQKIILEVTEECAQYVKEAAEKSGTTPERYIAGCIWRTVPKTISKQETKQAAEWALFDLKDYYV